MKFSTEWLSDYGPLPGSLHEIADKLTMTLTEVEEISSLEHLKDIKVGEVVELKAHPDADNLMLTKTKVGARTYDIVCGAPNVAVGAKVPVALPGVTLPSGLKIERRTIRDVPSNGMLCSARELAAGEDHEGIWLLPADAQTGKPLPQALAGSHDTFELDVLANRPDCMGHLGVAREIAAAFGSSFQEPKATRRPISGDYSVTLHDAEFCPRYGLARLTGLKNGKSPDWLKRRLQRLGVRPINAVVDIANYVMLDTAQPLHAFDTSLLSGKTIHVRTATDEETITTLDGVSRVLPRGAGLIADRDGAVAIAGILGGKDTEVSAGTTDIILESASFYGPSVRRTSRMLGVRTEASARFERGISRHLTMGALIRAAGLLEEICGAKLVQLSDYGSKQTAAKPVVLDIGKLEGFLGVRVSTADAKGILTRLGFGVTGASRALRVKPPPWRSDVTQAVDVYEEIIRIYGYDHVPATEPTGIVAPATESPAYRLERQVGMLLVGAGFTETMTHSLVGESLIAKTGYGGQDLVTIANPISQDHRYLRPSLEPRHLEAVTDNLRWTDTVRFFEMGTIFRPGGTRATQPNERRVVTATLATRGRQDRLPELRGILELLVGRLFHTTENLAFSPNTAGPYVRGRSFTVSLGRMRIGSIAEYAQAAEWKAGRIVFLTLDLTELCHHVPASRRVEPPPVYPAVFRDLSVFVPEGSTYDALRKKIRQAGGRTLWSVTDPQEFTRDSRRSLTVRLEFRSPERTLTDQEVHTAMDAIRATLTKAGYLIRD